MESWEIEWADYYAELRCSPDDPIEVISGIYRAIVKRYHPDRPQGDSAKMVRINAAFEVLGDPERRRAYDRAYAARQGASNGRGANPGTRTRGRSEPGADPGPGAEKPEPEPDIARGDSTSHDGPTSTVQRSPRHEAVPTGSPVPPRSDVEQSDEDAPVRAAGREPQSRFDPDHPFPIFVDYGKSVWQMVTECKFDLTYPHIDILKKYKHGKSGKITVTIFLYKPLIASNYDGLMVEIYDLGYRPANICELLTFGSTYPIEQIRNNICGYGTRIDMEQFGYGPGYVFPLLSGKGYDGRGLQLNPSSPGSKFGFSPHTRFAVVAV